jgi:hypothetical protein
VKIKHLGLRHGEDVSQVSDDLSIAWTLDLRAGIAQLNHRAVLTQERRLALFVQAHALHLFIGKIGIGPFARTASPVGDHHPPKPLVATVKALGDAVVGSNFKIILVGDDAQVRHALQGLDGATAIGNEDIVLGVAKGHSQTINPALPAPQLPSPLPRATLDGSKG